MIHRLHRLDPGPTPAPSSPPSLAGGRGSNLLGVDRLGLREIALLRGGVRGGGSLSVRVQEMWGRQGARRGTCRGATRLSLRCRRKRPGGSGRSLPRSHPPPLSSLVLGVYGGSGCFPCLPAWLLAAALWGKRGVSPCLPAWLPAAAPCPGTARPCPARLACRGGRRFLLACQFVCLAACLASCCLCRALLASLDSLPAGLLSSLPACHVLPAGPVFLARLDLQHPSFRAAPLQTLFSARGACGVVASCRLPALVTRLPACAVEAMDRRSG